MKEKYRFLIECLGFGLIESHLQNDSLGRDAKWCVQVLKKQQLTRSIAVFSKLSH